MDLRAAIDRATRAELLDALAHIAHRLALTEPTADDVRTDDVFLSTSQLAARIPFTVGSLNTYVSSGKLIENVHYTKKGHRTVWSWQAMKVWLTATEKEVTTQDDKLERITTQTRRRIR